MAPSVIGYVYNAVAGRFIAPSGQFVSVAQVRNALDQAIAASARDAAAIALELSTGAIGIPEFENQMRALIKDTQIYSAAVGAGGFNQLGATEISYLESRLREQFGYLSDWADDLAAGVQGAARQMPQRASMYAGAARSTFSDIVRAGQTARGFTQESNVLGNNEHCALCQAMTALGWVAIGRLIPIGQRTCLTNCKCRIDYR